MADTSVPITAGLGTGIGVELRGGLNYQVVLPGAHLATPYTEVAINCALNGDNTIIAAGGVGILHRLYGFFLASRGAVDVKWKDGAGSDFHPAIPMLGNGAFWFLHRDGNPWFTGTANTALILNLSGAVQVSGRAYYIASA